MNDQGHCMTIQITIPDELVDHIAERIEERLKPFLSKGLKKDDDSIFDVKGLADYLKSTEAWVREQAKSGTIPCFKSGKYWKFRKRDIDRHFPSRSLIPISRPR